MILSGSTYRELQREMRETRDIAVKALSNIESHAASCVELGRHIQNLILEGRTINDQRHRENQDASKNNRDAIDGVHGRITALGRQMLLMVIAGFGAVILALIGAVYAIFAHKLGLS